MRETRIAFSLLEEDLSRRNHLGALKREPEERSSREDNSGGGGGIRTHGTVSRTAVFKTAALNHSTTPPGAA
jgi:hypothetical protein